MTIYLLYRILSSLHEFISINYQYYPTDINHYSYYLFQHSSQYFRLLSPFKATLSHMSECCDTLWTVLNK